MWGDEADRFLCDSLGQNLLSTRKSRLCCWYLVTHGLVIDMEGLYAIAAIDPNMEGAPGPRNISAAKAALELRVVSKSQKASRKPRKQAPQAPPDSQTNIACEVRDIMEDCKIDTMSTTHLREEWQARFGENLSSKKLAQRLRESRILIRRPVVDTPEGKCQTKGVILREVKQAVDAYATQDAEPERPPEALTIEVEQESDLKGALIRELETLNTLVQETQRKQEKIRALAASLFPESSW